MEIKWNLDRKYRVPQVSWLLSRFCKKLAFWPFPAYSEGNLNWAKLLVLKAEWLFSKDEIRARSPNPPGLPYSSSPPPASWITALKIAAWFAMGHDMRVINLIMHCRGFWNRHFLFFLRWLCHKPAGWTSLHFICLAMRGSIIGCSSLQDSLKLGPVQLLFSFEICSCAKVFELLSYAFCSRSSSLTSQFSCLHQFCARVQLLLMMMGDVKFTIHQ